MNIACRQHYNINKKIINYVKDNLPYTQNKLQLAIAIYILTGKIFEYSSSFHLYENDKKFKLTHNLTLENNKLICTQWAKIYYMLLKIFGIKTALVDNNGHSYVIFRINNIIYEADITSYRCEKSGNEYRLSDIANIKFGFDLRRFRISLKNSNITKEEKNTLNNEIKYVQNLFNQKIITNERINKLTQKVQNKIKNHKDKYDLKDSIEYRINILNHFCKFNFAKGELERHALFYKYMPELFFDLNNNVNYIPLYSIKKDVKISILICINIDDNILYYLQTPDGFINIKEENLIQELLKRKLHLSNCEIIPYVRYDEQDVLILENTYCS